MLLHNTLGDPEFIKKVCMWKTSEILESLCEFDRIAGMSKGHIKEILVSIFRVLRRRMLEFGPKHEMYDMIQRESSTINNCIQDLQGVWRIWDDSREVGY